MNNQSVFDIHSSLFTLHSSFVIQKGWANKLMNNRSVFDIHSSLFILHLSSRKDGPIN